MRMVIRLTSVTSAELEQCGMVVPADYSGKEIGVAR
jgi:hypothetical protein